MSAAAVISYPQSFLERPADRLFKASLTAEGIEPDMADLMLYRVWRDFASGGSDRRALTTPEGPDPQYQLLADFAGYRGAASQFIEQGLSAGFFRLEADMLVCSDFYPINSPWTKGGMSIQKKGAFTRPMRKQAAESAQDAERQMEVWDRTKPSDLDAIAVEQRRAGVILIHRMARACNFHVLPDAELRKGPLQEAVRLLETVSVKQLDDTLLWLLSRPKDPTIPRNLPALLASWPTLVEQAARELG